MQNQQPPILMPTLVSGVGAGVVTSIPILGGILLCACCAPMIGAGFVAAYLYSRRCQQARVEFRAGRGAFLGLVTSLFFALTSAVLSAGLRIAMPGPGMDEIRRQIEANPQMTEEALEMSEKVLQFVEQASPVFILLLSFLFLLVLAAIFSTIGGAIGGAVFKVEEPSPAASEPGA